MRTLLLIVVLLTGCATTQVRVVDVPEPPVIEVPDTPVHTGDGEQDAKNLANYILTLRTRLRQALEALDVYRPTPQK